MRIFVLVLITLMTLPPGGIVLAQSSEQFDVSLQTTGFTDTSPPSVPAGLSATALSATQVNLSWIASTDNVAVDGYNVFRDTVFIASTTATNYLDGGVFAETTYAYTVSAFDASNNESARSSTSSATTLASTTPGVGGGGPSIDPEPILSDVTVEASTTEATLTWTTDIPTRSTIRWGTTVDYELGTVQRIDYQTNHSVTLTDLLPGQSYYFEITVASIQNETARVQGQFTTISLPDKIPPANPTNFTAEALGPNILTLWRNPLDTDFESVRLVRSDLFYPVDPLDGATIYEGSAESFLDADVEANKTYYYTLFALDTEGNYSSGAIASAIVIPTILTPPPTTTSGGGSPGSGGGTPGTQPPEPSKPPKPDPFDGLPTAPTIPNDIQALELLDFVFEQNGQRLTSQSGTIILDGSEPFTIYLPSDQVPNVLKTIGITIHDPINTNKVFSFLLRINGAHSKYTGTIGKLDRPGTYPFTITVIDFKNQKLKELQGSLLVQTSSLVDDKETTPATFVGFIVSWLWIILLIPLLILLLLLLLLVKRRKKEKEEEQTELYQIQHHTQ